MGCDDHGETWLDREVARSDEARLIRARLITQNIRPSMLTMPQLELWMRIFSERKSPVPEDLERLRELERSFGILADR